MAENNKTTGPLSEINPDGTAITPDSLLRAQLRREIRMNEAFGLLLGALEGVALRLPKEEREPIMRITKEARDLWHTQP